MNFLRAAFALLVLSLAQASLAESESDADERGPEAKTNAVDTTKEKEMEKTYVFGWGEVPADRAKTRGGTSDGAPVKLAPPRTLPSPAIAEAKDAFARDRATILALAGDHRVSFHFLESVGLSADFQADRPYHSWATEKIHLLEDRGDFISLQHTLEMHFREKDGKTPEPSLVKHWRQDWTYRDRDLLTYRGDSVWARRRASEAEAAGAWSQAVYGVEDAPRYEALGRWEHRGNLSVWTSETFWRPLPRREHSARKDYTVLEGVHRIVITPTGWLHEQRNWKRVAGEDAKEADYLSGEIGLDRYERLASPELNLATSYWERTGPFWTTVRKVWSETLAERERFRFKSKVAGETLYEQLFDYAEGIGEEGSAAKGKTEAEAEGMVRQWIGEHLEAAD